MQAAENIFEEYIAQHSLKDTAQRRQILQAFLEHRGHISAEEFYYLLREKGIAVGQATVYRTLELLCNCGLAIEVHFGDGMTRYELAYGNEHHDHLICQACRENIEVMDKEIEALQGRLAAKYGYTLTSHYLYLYGLCPKCKAKGHNLPEPGKS